MSFSKSQLTDKDIAETWSALFLQVGPSGSLEISPDVVCVVFQSLLGLRHMELNETLFALISEFFPRLVIIT